MSTGNAFFRQLWSVARKELRDFARDRRTLALTLLMGPLLYPAIMLGIGTMAESRARTQLDETLKVPVVGAEHAPHLVAFLAGHGIEVAEPPAGQRVSTSSTTAPAATPRFRSSACSPPCRRMPARSARCGCMHAGSTPR